MQKIIESSSTLKMFFQDKPVNFERITEVAEQKMTEFLLIFHELKNEKMSKIEIVNILAVIFSNLAFEKDMQIETVMQSYIMVIELYMPRVEKDELIAQILKNHVFVPRLAEILKIAQDIFDRKNQKFENVFLKIKKYQNIKFKTVYMNGVFFDEVI